MRRLFLLLLGCALLLPQRSDSAAAPARHPALAGLPRAMLWAWERPEDLRWLPSGVGVAYVASTIVLEGDQVLLSRRAQPLLLAPGSAVVPVLHVDASWRQPPSLSDEQSRRIAAELLRVAPRGNRQVVQLDFEVRRSQRAFLARTIRAIRAQLPPATALSVTALASWCLDDDWMGGSGADEVVPMAFRMGRDQQQLRARLQGQRGFTRPHCRAAIGLASDEAMVSAPASRHYFFSPQPWTAASWQAVLASPRLSLPGAL